MNKGHYLIIFSLILILSVLLIVNYNSNLNLIDQLNLLYRQVQHQVQINLPTNCRTTMNIDSPSTFIRFAHNEDSLEMEVGGNQANNNQAYSHQANQDNRNEFKLRTKNESMASNVSNSILFTVEENDQISFDNPFFKKDNQLLDSKGEQI